MWTVMMMAMAPSGDIRKNHLIGIRMSLPQMEHAF
jgi:hypothetical protein